ncbi:MAG: Phosphoglycolate phosphatase [Chlamydiae bacterium]|nr:Phosphoglycolate phosphatase [Chlamydiota bacterium]
MLVIFDLDDTLIETSKCLTTHYLHIAFVAMQSAGLEVEENAFDELLSINEKELSSRFALKKFYNNYSDQIRIYEAGFAALKTPLPEEISLEIVPGALEVLDELQTAHTLALVTAGDSNLQRQKLEKAGIQPERFSKLVIGKGLSKKLDYQRVLSELNVHPQEVLVCGDRVPIDLTPAKQLGLCTVHFRNGRGLVHDEPKADVDFTIHTLKQLNEVFAKHES